MRGNSNLPGQNNVDASQVMMKNGTSVEDAVTKVTENANEDGVMSVSGGGTGLNTLTAGSYLVGNGTEDVQLKTPAEVLSDIGAAAASHTQAASTITAGAFAGQVAANSSGQTYSTYLLRNQKLSTAEETPTVNGQICWLCS